MIDRQLRERDPATVFAVAVSCGVAFWIALALLFFERRPLADAVMSTGRFLQRILA